MPRTSTSDVLSRVVGTKLRQARAEVGISQAELGRRLGVRPAYVAALEAGKHNPTIGQLATVAAALGVGLDIGFPVPVLEYKLLKARGSR